MWGLSAELGLDRAVDGLAVQRQAALVCRRLGRPLRRAGQGQRAGRAQALAGGVHGEFAKCHLLEAAGDAARGRHGAQPRRRGAGELQHAVHVRRFEVEGDVGPRLRRAVVGDGAAHRQPRAGQVRDLDVVQPERVAAQRDVDIDAADRLLVPDQLGDLGFQPDRGAGRAGGGRGWSSRSSRRLLLGRRRGQVGIEVERVEIDLHDHRQRHAEGHGDAAAALEVVELEDRVAHLHVAAIRRHPALQADPGELVGRNRRHVDGEPGQRLAQLRPDQAEIAGDSRPVGIARQGRLGLQHQIARQGGGELRDGDDAAARLELERDVAHRLLVVDQLADLEGKLGGDRGEQAGPRRRRRCRRGAGRRRRRRGLRRCGLCHRGQPAVEVEPVGRELALDRERRLQRQRQRTAGVVLAQRQLEIPDRDRRLRGVDGAVEGELAGEQRRQVGLRLAGHLDQGVGKADQVVRRAGGDAGEPRVGAELAQLAVEAELAARLQGEVDGMTVGGLGADRRGRA